MVASDADRHARRTAAIHLRATSMQQDLIDRAARALGKTRSEFMLESACSAAEEALMDRVEFTLSDAQYRELERVLDAPAPPNEALRAFVRKRAPWERE